MIQYEPQAGMHISKACEEAIRRACAANEPAEFDFNDIKMVAEPGMDPLDLADQYAKESERRRKEYEASEEYKKALADEVARDRKARADYAKAMDGTPDRPSLIDPVTWEEAEASNQDSYGARALAYARDWGVMMEKEISPAKKLTKEIVDRCAEIADYDGITGFMHSWAKGLLIRTWLYGAELETATKR